MIEILSEVTGVVIAAGIIAGVRKLGDLTNAVRDLDGRVSLLERSWMRCKGLSECAGRSDQPGPTEVRSSDC